MRSVPPQRTSPSSCSGCCHQRHHSDPPARVSISSSGTGTPIRPGPLASDGHHQGGRRAFRPGRPARPSRDRIALQASSRGLSARPMVGRRRASRGGRGREGPSTVTSVGTSIPPTATVRDRSASSPAGPVKRERNGRGHQAGAMEVRGMPAGRSIGTSPRPRRVASGQSRSEATAGLLDRSVIADPTPRVDHQVQVLVQAGARDRDSPPPPGPGPSPPSRTGPGWTCLDQGQLHQTTAMSHGGHLIGDPEIGIGLVVPTELDHRAIDHTGDPVVARHLHQLVGGHRASRGTDPRCGPRTSGSVGPGYLPERSASALLRAQHPATSALMQDAAAAQVRPGLKGRRNGPHQLAQDIHVGLGWRPDR